MIDKAQESVWIYVPKIYSEDIKKNLMLDGFKIKNEHCNLNFGTIVEINVSWE